MSRSIRLFAAGGKPKPNPIWHLAVYTEEAGQLAWNQNDVDVDDDVNNKKAHKTPISPPSSPFNGGVRALVHM